MKVWHTEGEHWVSESEDCLVGNWGVIKSSKRLLSVIWEPLCPPDGCGMTPKSSTLHIQEVLAVPLGRSRCLDWEAVLRKGHLRDAFCGAACLEGTWGESKESHGPGFLFFIFKLFNLRGWRWDNFLLAGWRLHVNHSLPFACSCSRKNKTRIC